jgi:trigger factor
MLKNVESISATKKRIHIEVPGEAMEGEIQSSLNALRQKSRLPGFRPGKAPMGLIEKRYGKDVESQAVEKMVPEYYSRALEEAELTPVSAPVIEGGMEYKRNGPLSFSVTVEVMPEIKDLHYEGVKVTDLPREVSEEDMDKTLQKLRRERASYEPSEEPAGQGDMVVMDYETVGEEEGSRGTDEVFEVGSGQLPPEFSENVTGKKKGETVEFDVAFPEEHPAEEPAGGTQRFRVTLKEVKNVRLPELDDEFAKDMDFDDLAKLREHVRERLEKSKNEQVDNILKAEVLKKVIGAHEPEAPESLLKQELDHLVARARAQGRREDSEEALREELRPEAERQVRASLLLRVIGKKEGVEVAEEDVKNRVVELAMRLHLTPENVVKYYVSRDGSLEGLKDSIFEEKVLDILLKRAEVEQP